MNANSSQTEFLGRRCHMIIVVLKSASKEDQQEKKSLYEQCKDQTIK